MSLVASLPSPTDLVELPFMRTALLELALLAVAGGLLGAWIVLRRLAFFAHAVGTATFPGLVVADATGFSATLAGLAVALGYAGGVERAGRADRDPGDVATALALVVALALGVVLASDVFESGAAVDRLLFGTALGLDGGDLWLAAGVAALALAATLLLGRAWTTVGFDDSAAGSLGLPVRTADLLLLGLIGVAAVAALPAVGALLVASLFVVPAATARQLTDTVAGLLAVSVAIAAAQGAIGLYVSLWLDVPPGPAVAVVGSGLYALVAGTCAFGRRSRAVPLAAEAT
ncbi:MAG TPA: metal ABC transporter permease [Thermoleophilaceae bacterium]|nr:metal ABC transporter permease [Thermoleophilaceae bacterium]